VQRRRFDLGGGKAARAVGGHTSLSSSLLLSLSCRFRQSRAAASRGPRGLGAARTAAAAAAAGNSEDDNSEAESENNSKDGQGRRPKEKKKRDAGADRSAEEGSSPQAAKQRASGVRSDLSTPAFDLGDRALQVLSEASFEPYGHMEEARRSVLRGRTIGKVFEEFVGKSDSGRDALVLLSNTVGVSFLRLREYYSTADMATKKHFAAILLQNKYMGDFSECVVEIGSSLDPLLLVTPMPRDATQQRAVDERVVDMSFLSPLVLPNNEPFLIPASIYVRDCMRMIFDFFCDDIKADMTPDSKNTALIGSPGVGKSILFFLAALYQATSKMVVYYRLTKAPSERASLFFMAPAQNGGVSVWFSRNIDKGAIGQLSSLRSDLEKALDIRREEYYTYLDGPNHMEENYLLKGTYDYFCTSGGFPLYKDHETGKRLWVLDGWSQDEAIAALNAAGYDEPVASYAYSLSGGNIRRMLDACTSPDRVRRNLDIVIGKLSMDAMILALQSTDGSDDPVSPDRLRTMFFAKAQLQDEVETWKEVMDTVQIVDSKYF
jgi:hypothetical protein